MLSGVFMADINVTQGALRFPGQCSPLDYTMLMHAHFVNANLPPPRSKKTHFTIMHLWFNNCSATQLYICISKYQEQVKHKVFMTLKACMIDAGLRGQERKGSMNTKESEI